MAIHNKQTPHTLPPSPIHHHSSSDFQFTISLSPPNSSATDLRPADELFYNGQLLPLHLSPRNSMVRTLIATTARHSNYQPSRPSSATKDDINHLRLPPNQKKLLITKQFSFNRFSTVFRKENKPASTTTKVDSATKTFKEKIRKYMKKLSQVRGPKTTPPMVKNDDTISYSFSGNLRILTKTGCVSVSSCPSSMPPSPNHSGVLCQKGIVNAYTNRSSSATEELQSAIQGAIAHCKNSMTQ